MKKIITFLIIISLIIVNVQARELNIETDASETSGFYGGTLERNKVEKMYFTSSVAVPNGIAISYDGSKEKDKSIMVWYKDADNNGLYEAHVGSESGINAPKKSENIFKNFTKLKKIDISKLNMINVSDVEKIFSSLSSLEEVVIKKSNILKLDKFASSMSNKYLILNSGIDSSEVKNIKDKDNNTKTGLVKTGDFIGTNKVIVLGDINSDGKISSLDYVKVKNHIMESTLIADKELILAADYNEDDKINSLDYVKIKNYIMEEVNNPSYEISFSLNEGTGDTLSYASIKKNQAMPTINKSIPSRSGYTFMGWYDNSDYTQGTQYYDENQKSVKNYDKNSDIVLYPGWGGTLKIYFYSNQRKDAILIVGNGTTLFIDGGLAYDGYVANKFIKSLGITKIDGLIGSHTDDNHIEAHLKILQEGDVQVAHAYYPVDISTCVADKTCKGGDTADPTKLSKKLQEENIPVTVLTTGENIKIGNLTFDIVGPQEIATTATQAYPDNYNSLNMILKFGKNKFYFAGDGVQQDAILQKYSAETLKVDVLKYPHHGQYALNAEFLNTLSPKYIAITHTQNKINEYIDSNAQNALKEINPEYLIVGNKETFGNVLMESDGKTITITKKFTP